MVLARLGAILLCISIIALWTGRFTKKERKRRYLCYAAFGLAVITGFLDVPLYILGVEHTVTAFVQSVIPYPASLIPLAAIVFITGVKFGFVKMVFMLTGVIAGHLFW